MTGSWNSAELETLRQGLDKVAARLQALIRAAAADQRKQSYGSEVDIPLAWDDIRSVARRKHVIQERQPKVTVQANGEAALHMRMQNETNIEVELKEAMPLRLPHGTETVSRVHLYADDPAAFLSEGAAVRLIRIVLKLGARWC